MNFNSLKVLGIVSRMKEISKINEARTKEVKSVIHFL